jgi:hypothetical protein
MAIAKNEPAATSHIGAVGGMLYAKRSPVSKALPSKTVIRLLLIAIIAASVIMAEIIDAIIRYKDLIPNINTPAMPAGRSDNVTAHIILVVDSSDLIWGPIDILSESFIISAF